MKKYFFFLFVIFFTRQLLSQNFWQPTNGPSGLYGADNVGSLAINVNGYIFAGTWGMGGGIYRSTNDGNDWIQINSGLISGDAKDVNSLAINETNGLIFAGTYAGLFTSTNNGDLWVSKNSGLVGNVVSELVSNTYGYVFAIMGSNGLFRSTNNGDNWTKINNGLTTTDISSLCTNASGHLFVGTSYGGLFRSTNNGDNWTQLNSILTSGYVVALAINTDGYIFVGSSKDGLFRSTNNGDNWTQINNGLTSPYPYIQSLVINSNGHIFVGTHIGVFLSTNNGNNWTQINAGLASINILSLAINAGGHIFAGIDHGGVFKSINPTTYIKEEDWMFTDYKLFQNYPNPFNPSTKINYLIPKSEYVQLKVFDLLGREIKSLLNKYQIAGKYELIFDGTLLPSGIYFYKIISGNYSDTKKMILLR